METYIELLQRPEWKIKSMKIKQRDGKKCRNCGSKKNLQVHHRQYHWSRRLNGHIFPWAYKNQYLITLCDRCHYYGHKKYTVQTFKIK
jgi:hypothetical protein